METEIIKVDPLADCAAAVRRAVDVLQRGGLVAFPTETVYGVAARADHEEAVAGLRTVKSRANDKAFTVHIARREELRDYVSHPSGLAERLVRKTWPGPMTLIVAVDDPMSAPIMAGRDGSVAAAMYYDQTIGLRCPDDAIAQAILRDAGGPVVAASGNAKGAPPPRSGPEVLADLSGKIDLLIDSGTTRYAQPSTIVRVTGSVFEVIREGVLDAGTIARLVVLRFLFVCTGNTCRSPMAEGIARQRIARHLGCDISELPKKGIEVASAGTAGGFGPAAEHACEAMTRREINISGHISQHLTADLVRQADYVYGMTQSHVDRIMEMVPGSADRVFRLDPDRDVRDPISGTDDDYERCAVAIEEAIDARLTEVAL